VERASASRVSATEPEIDAELVRLQRDPGRWVQLADPGKKLSDRSPKARLGDEDVERLEH
jgi:hypothetical protein